MRERTRSINNTTDFLITPIMYAPLETSLVLRKGTGDPTWSRATKAWGFNELGYLEELASGCAFFGGARLVRNSVRTTSEDFSNAAWIKFGSTTTPSANVVVCANATSAQYINQGGTLSLVPGQKLLYGVRAQKVVGGVDFIQIAGQSTTHGTGQFCNISLIDGTYSATSCSPVVTPLGGGAYDITVVFTCVAAGFDVYNIVFANALSSTRLEAFVGDGVKSFELLRAWSVDVTGYDASYIPEYVSVGVEASPYFGAGIDGAKYFSTDYTGGHALTNLVGFRREAAATNNLLGSRDFFINWTPGVVAGTLFSDDFSSYANTAAMTAAGWTAASITTQTLDAAAILITNAGAVYGSSSKTLTTEIGKTYLVTFAFTKTTANCGAYVANTATASSIDRLNTVSATVTGAYSLVFTATATTTYLVFGLNSNTAGHAIKIDDVLVKESKVTVTKTTGLDGIANTATTLTATAADAIILQPTSGIASADRCASAYVKRRTGTGTISFTQDGTNWTDITAQINSITWSRVQITGTLADPSVGFKISTSGDEIDVDVVQNEAGPVATSPIVTTTTAISRNAESLTYQTAGNIDFAVGTLFAIALSNIAATTRGVVYVGSSYFGTTSGSATTSFRINDGTTNLSKSGMSAIDSAPRKRAGSWGPAGLSVTGDGLAPSVGAFDGDFGNGASISIGENLNGYIGPVAIYNYQMTDAQLQEVTK